MRKSDSMPQQQEAVLKFTKQQNDLETAFEKLKKTARNKITKINNGTLNMNDEETLTRSKQKLNTEVEALHLAVSNYFGDCDRRKQKIEAEISTRLDVEGFSDIANQILAI